jgi:carbon-monoxide dehydrogenase medium subunit
VKPSPFTYHAPTTVEECAGLLARYGDEAKPLAGGQSLVPMMNLRLAAPGVLVDLNGIPELEYIHEDGGTLVIGAMTRHRDVAASAEVARLAPLLAHAATRIGYPPIRARGTIGGSLAHADPVAEMPCAAVALGAELVIASASGRRRVAAEDFFAGYFTTTIGPGELLVEIRYPPAMSADGWGFAELQRKPGDYAVVAAAVAGGRIALAGVADRPVRATAAEAALAAGEDFDTAAAAAAGIVERPFQRHLTSVLTRRALEQAAGGA